MAVSFFLSPFPLASPFRNQPFASPAKWRARASPERKMDRAKQLVAEFPHLLQPHKDVLSRLVSTVDSRLASHLLPSSESVPADVEFYQNKDGSSVGCLSVNRGVDSSPIDMMLTSCLRLQLPNGAEMKIATLQSFLKASTDAPHLVFELAQYGPAYFVLSLDLISRKDLVLHPEYLKSVYEDSPLEVCRRGFFEQVPEAQPYNYMSSSLYLRSLLSPTGILAAIKCDEGSPERIEEIMRDHIGPVADEVIGIWIDYVCSGRSVAEEERGELERRDHKLKINAYEMDLGPKFPMVFGEGVADRVLRVIRDAFGI